MSAAAKTSAPPTVPSLTRTARGYGSEFASERTLFAAPDLSETVKEDSVKVAENDNEYIARFKIVEIYEKIKNFLK